MLRIISFERQNGVFSGIVNLFKTAKLVEFYNQHTLPPTILYHRTTKLGLCEESNLLLNEARGEGGEEEENDEDEDENEDEDEDEEVEEEEEEEEEDEDENEDEDEDEDDDGEDDYDDDDDDNDDNDCFLPL